MPPEPQGWQDDPLSRFFQMATYNSCAIFDRYRTQWKLLAGIDAAFDRLVANLAPSPYQTSVFLLQRSHSAYLAALRLVLATQYVDAYPLLRSTLEYGLYALYFRDHPSAFEDWSKRHFEGKKSREKARKSFSNNKMLNHLKKKDERLGEFVKKSYDETIDLGAHPNPGAVASAYREVVENGETYTEINYFAGEGLGFRLAIQRATNIGVQAIEVASCAFPERAKILGIPQELEATIRRYGPPF